MRNFNRFLLLTLMFFLVVSSVYGAYRPVPDNRNLEEIFNSIKVEGEAELTRVRYVPDNDEAWYCRWKMIKEAKDSIDCTYYIIDKDIFGQAFLGLLLNKARHGVRIRLMIDGRVYRMPYMSKMPDKIQELAAFPNVEIKLYNSVSKSLAHLFKGVKQVFASNHDKIIIVDKETCMVGGRNIGADYFSGQGENDIVYRDTDVLMQSRYVAKQLTKAFEEEWNLLRNSVVKEDFINFKDQLATVDLAYRVMSRYMQGRGMFDPEKVRVSKKLVKALKEMNKEISKYKNISSYSGFRLFRGERKKSVKILDKHSYIGALNGITPNIISMIGACEHEIIIQNPYLVITEEAEAALKRAAQRGVKIIFHTNSAESTDSPFPQAFLLNDWKRILKEMPGARLLVAPSQNERLHSKTFVFDSQITIVGSYNMDPLSEQINSEVVAAIYDKSFATRTRLQIIKKDLKKFIEYRIETDDQGRVIKAYGPKDHVNKKTLRRLKILSKIGWLRPLI